MPHLIVSCGMCQFTYCHMLCANINSVTMYDTWWIAHAIIMHMCHLDASMHSAYMLVSHMIHLDVHSSRRDLDLVHYMMTHISRRDVNLVEYLSTWDLVEIHLMLYEYYSRSSRDCQHECNTKSSWVNTKISMRSRLDYNTNKTRSQHEDLDDFLCPDFQKFSPRGLTKRLLHGTLAKSTTPQRVTDGYSRILSL